MKIDTFFEIVQSVEQESGGINVLFSDNQAGTQSVHILQRAPAQNL